jgi:hypothetical protein
MIVWRWAGRTASARTPFRQALGDAGLERETWAVIGEDEGDGRLVEFLWFTARKVGG